MIWSKSLLLFTIGLGCLFTLMQILEFKESTFSLGQNVYTCTFYALTGLHGLHVVVGTIMLIVVFCRLQNMSNPKLGFLTAVWYWHFVDVVWILVYIFLYYWPYFGQIL